MFKNKFILRVFCFAVMNFNYGAPNFHWTRRLRFGCVKQKLHWPSGLQLSNFRYQYWHITFTYIHFPFSARVEVCEVFRRKNKGKR